MRQRVMIAIALSCDPKLLIADEPTTALDVTVQASVLDLLDDLRHEHEMAMIIITHDMGVVAEAADDIIVMYAGQVVEHATTLDLFDNPEHPYTEALLGALPQIEGEGIRQGRLTAIPGRPPDLLAPPAACRFGPRCPYAGSDSCTEHEPELRELRPGHWVRSAHPASRAGRGAHAREGARMSATPTKLLEVTDLHKHFPIREGLLIERKVGEVKAVDGVSFDVDEGETLGLVGRVGLGQVDDRLLHPPAHEAHLRLDSLRGDRADGARPRGDAQDAARDADRLPGPVLVARPAHDGRRHRRRAAGRARDRHAAATAACASASCSTSSASIRASRTAIRTSSRAASASASGSRERSPSRRS